ncbi:MAG: hypothetical protein JXA67_09795 [Micromonosporaceae bacterium]|nr:hypothetical protein [Micromonosporaceae bacterium]
MASTERGTRPTGRPGGVPSGRPTRIGSRQDESVRRSLERENDSAVVLAGRGYRVLQNPSPQQVSEARTRTGDAGRPESEPDYLIEGRVFDCYAPKYPKSVRNIWSEVSTKVDRGQTQRVVLNLQDWGSDLETVRRQFADWPVEGLREVKAITPDRHVVEIWHA